MNNINKLKITLILGSLVAVCACKKSSGPANPGSNKSCYVTETDFTQGSSTSKTILTYNADHSLAGVAYVNSTPSDDFYKYLRSDNTLRIDHYKRTNDVLGKHSGYRIYALNTRKRADSLLYYSCVDCNLDEPTTFKFAGIPIRCARDAYRGKRV